MEYLQYLIRKKFEGGASVVFNFVKSGIPSILEEVIYMRKDLLVLNLILIGLFNTDIGREINLLNY